MRGLHAFLLFVSLTTVACTSHETHRVAIRQMAFDPAELTVRSGDAIVFTNEDFVEHTVTADDKRFDSGRVAANAQWSLTLHKIGDVSYGCTLHPTMKGRIVVK
jgi:plastocyanin